MTSTFVTVPGLCSVTPTAPSLLKQRLLGLRRSSLRTNAVATKWEPAKCTAANGSLVLNLMVVDFGGGTRVVPQADRVLVRLEELPEKSAGGVLLPKSAVKFERYLVGEVLFSDVSAYEVDLGGDARHCFAKASDLLAVVE